MQLVALISSEGSNLEANLIAGDDGGRTARAADAGDLGGAA